MNEQQPSRTETTTSADSREQQLKTLAVRMDQDQHARLQFIAQLSGTSIAEEIRGAIEQRIAAAQSDADLLARAEAARQEIEREAAARAAAIAGFIGTAATASTTTVPAPGAGSRTRRSSKTTVKQGE